MATYDVTNVINAARTIAQESINMSAKRVLEHEEREALKLWRGAREVTRVAKVEMESYKLFKINPESFFNEKLSALLKVMRDMNKNDAESIEAGRKAFQTVCAGIDGMINSGRSFVVDPDKCKIENGRRSLASDIAGVAYGHITDNIIVVHHDIYNVVSAKAALLGNTPKEGIAMLDELQQKVVYLLVHNGVDLGGKHYDAWASTSSQQKTGALYMGEHSMMERTEDARMYGSTLAEINAAGGDNGAELLKRQALLFTPSVPYVDENGNVLRLRDCVMFNDVDIERNCGFVLNVGKDASIKCEKSYPISMTMGDGEAYGPFSAQIRGLGIKAFCVKKDGMEEFIADKHNTSIPETVEDYDHNVVKLEGKKLYLTKSCWKGAKLGLSWAEFVDRAEKLAEKYPLIDAIRIVRFSDSTDPSKRRLTRQSVQQWLNATDEQLRKLSAYEVSRLNTQKTLTGALVKFAGFESAEEDRTDFNRLFEAVPSILCSAQMQNQMREIWNRDLCEAAAGRVRVHGSYPYIAMDPVAMLEILVFGMNPNRRSLGVLKEGEINLPMTDEGQEVYGVRYPNNHINGQIFVNRNHEVFADVGEVAILPYHGFAIVRFDGDFDGDEMSVITDRLVVNLMKQIQDTMNLPVINFPHDKAARRLIVDAADYDKEIAIALWRGQKYNKVGTYSNLATKIMQAAAMAPSVAERRALLLDAVYAHVGAILVIDMIKTGEMPAGIQAKLNALAKRYPMMPWNQRFNKSNGSEWESAAWDEKIAPESDYVCDRLARAVLDRVGTYSFDKEGIEFDPSVLLSKRDDLPKYAAKGVVDNATLKQIRAMNYMDDARKILTDIQRGERISPKGFMEFFWQNACSLSRRVTDRKIEDEKELRAEYVKFVRNTMLNLGDGEKWDSLNEEQKYLTVVNYFVRDAFEVNGGNGIENKGGYLQFVLEVFATDILKIYKENC